MTSGAVLDAIVSLQAAVGDVLKHFDNGDLGCLSEDEFAEAAGELEATRRTLATADYAVVAEIESRELADRQLARNPAGYLPPTHMRSHPDLRDRAPLRCVPSGVNGTTVDSSSRSS